MAYKGQGSFGITPILYTYQACKTLIGLIKPISLNKGQSSFGKPV